MWIAVATYGGHTALQTHRLKSVLLKTLPFSF